jgi:hypothetical protein
MDRQLYFDPLQGKVKIQQGDKEFTVSPAIFLKLFQDWASADRDRRLKRAELKKKEKGAAGGIRVILPSPVVDPLLRPGQPPRGLRLLGQDPSKPLPDTTGTTTKEPAGPLPGLIRLEILKSQSIRVTLRGSSAQPQPPSSFLIPQMTCPAGPAAAADSQ